MSPTMLYWPFLCLFVLLRREVTAAEGDEATPTPDANLNKEGNVHFKAKEFQEALTKYSGAIEINAAEPKYYRNRGVCLAQLGQPELALEDFTKAKDMDPKNPQSWYYLGRQLFQMGRYEEAMEPLEQAIEEKGDGYSYAARKMKAKAMALLNKARDILDEVNDEIERKNASEQDVIGTSSPSAKQLVPIEANRLFLQGKFKEASEKYTEAIKLHSKEPKYYRSRAFCYRYLEKPDLALADYKKAVELSPKNVKFQFLLGRYLFRMKKQRDAVEHLEKALELAEERYMTQREIMTIISLLATCRKKLKDPNEAVAMDISTPSDDAQATPLENDGNRLQSLTTATESPEKLMREGQFEQAKNYYSAAIKSNSKVATNYRKRGYCFSKLNQGDSAVADFKKAVSLEPNNARNHLLLGRQLLEMNKFKDAVKELEKALDLAEERYMIGDQRFATIAMLEEVSRREQRYYSRSRRYW